MGTRNANIPYTTNHEANHTSIVKTMQEMIRRLDRLENAPKIRGELDMQGNRIINIGSSSKTGHAVTYDDAVERGMFVNANGQHVAHSDIICRGAVRSRAIAVEPFDLVPLRQLRSLLGNVTDSLVIGTAVLTLANGVNHNVELDGRSTVYTVSGPTAAFSISGFLDGSLNVVGRLVVIVNGTTHPMTILDRAHGFSLADNRIATNKDADMATQRDGVVMLCYLTPWRVLAAVL